MTAKGLTHRASRNAALDRWRKRLDKLANLNHKRRREDYQGVEAPKERAYWELRAAIKDALAFGYTVQNIIGEVRDCAKDGES